MPKGIYKRTKKCRKILSIAQLGHKVSDETKQKIKEANITHGHCIDGIMTGTYVAWYTMHQRCNNPNDKGYKNYGDRGITVCERWLKFENFYADMGERPKGLTLERKNNNGNYGPPNCKWATWKEQNRNSRNNKLTLSKVQTIKKLLKESLLTQVDIANIFRVTPTTICYIKKGEIWSD